MSPTAEIVRLPVLAAGVVCVLGPLAAVVWVLRCERECEPAAAGGGRRRGGVRPGVRAGSRRRSAARRELRDRQAHRHEHQGRSAAESGATPAHLLPALLRPMHAHRAPSLVWILLAHRRYHRAA